MIVFLGDIHGDFAPLRQIAPFLGEDDIVIQVGDFGFYPGFRATWPNDFKFTTYAIDGNHEDFRIVGHQTEVTEMANNLFYVPRGTVLTSKGVKIGFLGGGSSTDKADRTPGKDWFRKEIITEEQVMRLCDNVRAAGGVNYLVTHTPGKSFIKTWFPKLDLAAYDLPPDWVDISAEMVDAVLATVDFGQHICGHMHRTVYDGKTRCLGVGEWYVTYV
jgi:hypothetical protein